MKLLRNPWVVGALALGAIAMLVIQVFKPQWDRWRQRVAATVAAKNEVQKPVPAAPPAASAPKAIASSPRGSASIHAPPPKIPGQPEAEVNIDQVASRFAQWVSGPARDPFFGLTGIDPNSVPEGPAPVQSWALTGIWRQTGGQFAAINGRVYGEGDQIDGWFLERIEADQVVFRGTNRIERLKIFNRIQGLPPSAPPDSAPAAARRKLGQRPRPMEDNAVTPQPL